MSCVHDLSKNRLQIEEDLVSVFGQEVCGLEHGQDGLRHASQDHLTVHSLKLRHEQRQSLNSHQIYERH